MTCLGTEHEAGLWPLILHQMLPPGCWDAIILDLLCAPQSAQSNRKDSTSQAGPPVDSWRAERSFSGHPSLCYFGKGFMVLCQIISCDEHLTSAGLCTEEAEDERDLTRCKGG